MLPVNRADLSAVVACSHGHLRRVPFMSGVRNQSSTTSRLFLPGLTSLPRPAHYVVSLDKLDSSVCKTVFTRHKCDRGANKE